MTKMKMILAGLAGLALITVTLSGFMMITSMPLLAVEEGAAAGAGIGMNEFDLTPFLEYLPTHRDVKDRYRDWVRRGQARTLELLEEVHRTYNRRSRAMSDPASKPEKPQLIQPRTGRTTVADPGVVIFFSPFSTPISKSTKWSSPSWSSLLC